MRLNLVVAITLALAGVAHADGMAPGIGNCPHPPPKAKKAPPKKEVPPPAPAPVSLAVHPCPCRSQPGPEGPMGPPGPQGDKGEKGDDGQIQQTIIVLRDEVNLRLGVMGSVYAPHGDWGWGPALQITAPMQHSELAAEIGYAGPFGTASWSPGRQSGLMLHLGVAGLGRLSWTAGIRYDRFDGSAQNNNVSAEYLALDVGVVARVQLRWGMDLRATLGPTIGGLKDTVDSGYQFAIGGAGAIFVGGPL